ncbi:MAG: peptidoglycan-binding protein [Pseudomonadota bacterium]
MSTSSQRKGGQILIGFSAGVLAIAAAIFGLSFLFDPTEEQGDETAGTEQQADTESAAKNTAEADETAAAEPAVETDQAEVAAEPSSEAEDIPEVSTFRLEPDGQMLIAGRSPPGWETTIRLDADVIATFLPEANGDFVQFVTVDPSAQARVLTLSARSPATGEDVSSDAEIIIAPLSEPAASEPEASEPDASEPSASDPPSSDTPLLAEEDSDGDGAASDEETVATLSPDPSQPDTAEEPSPDTTQAEPAATDADELDVAAIEPDDASADTETAEDETGSQSTVLVSDEDGIRVLQPATDDTPPEVMSVVALDTISYSSSGEVELSGRASGDGFVQIYVDNAPVITSRVEEDGVWRSELPRLDSGVYTLRVDEVADDGTVLSRVETPFQKEDEQVLAEALEAGRAVQAITVQPGFTLWGISRERYGDGYAYVRIFEANRDLIRDPDLIYPGQVFSLPQ